MSLATATARPLNTRRRMSTDEVLSRSGRSTAGRTTAPLRDRLVLTFAPLVKYIVYKKVREMPARCEVEDFISCGLEALIQSIDRYDPAKGATLEQYAWTRIHGAVLDELRRQDWAPRSVRRWERDIERAADEFTTLHGRRPTAAELADAVGISVDELRRHRDEVTRSDMTSLNTLVLSDDETNIERIDTIASTDLSTDPLHADRQGRGEGPLPRGVRPPAAARARGRRPALRQEHDAGGDRHDPRRLRVARLPDPRAAEEDAARAADRRRAALPARRVGRRADPEPPRE